MNLYSIPTGNFKLDGGAMFGVVPKTLWQKAIAPDENNLCSWAMRCLLIQEGNKLILIDTGIGNKQSEKFFSHYHLHGNDTLEKSLAKYGFSKNDITHVVLTHLHFDHCGGAIEREGEQLVPAFKNAMYYTNQNHWNWATQPNAREKASFLSENILPIQQSGQLQFISTPAEENQSKFLTTIPSGIIDGLSFKLVNGHTNAMMLPQIQYKNNTLVYVADLLPSTAHIPMPYVMGYDMFPLTTLQEKKQFYTEALEKNFVLMFEHDTQNECCTLTQGEKAVTVGETFNLTSIL